MTNAPNPIAHVTANAWRGAELTARTRALPEEVAVALSYDRETFAVMMASPADLQDFALGFSLSEGIISHPNHITSFETIMVPEGIECRMTLTPQLREKLQARRRRIAGPVGCGLCGLDSLKEIATPLPKTLATATMPAPEIATAFKTMQQQQLLNHETRAVHAAAFYAPGQPLLVREDIGRHNALDKVIGAVALRGDSPTAGALLLTSRVSLDLIQKAAIFGTGIIAAISVPTARAVQEAHAAGITLIAIARDDGFELFTHPERILFHPPLTP